MVAQSANMNMKGGKVFIWRWEHQDFRDVLTILFAPSLIKPVVTPMEQVWRPGRLTSKVYSTWMFF